MVGTLFDLPISNLLFQQKLLSGGSYVTYENLVDCADFVSSFIV